MRLFHRHRDEPADEPPVNARIVRSRLESLIDRQDAVYEKLARRLGITPDQPKREG